MPRTALASPAERRSPKSNLATPTLRCHATTTCYDSYQIRPWQCRSIITTASPRQRSSGLPLASRIVGGARDGIRHHLGCEASGFEAREHHTANDDRKAEPPVVRHGPRRGAMPIASCPASTTAADGMHLGRGGRTYTLYLIRYRADGLREGRRFCVKNLYFIPYKV